MNITAYIEDRIRSLWINERLDTLAIARTLKLEEWQVYWMINRLLDQRNREKMRQQ